MNDIITTNDYALLTSLGFRSQFADSIVWQDDGDGNHWQAQLGESSDVPVVFIKHTKDYRRAPEQTLSRDEFVSLFMNEEKQVA